MARRKKDPLEGLLSLKPDLKRTLGRLRAKL